MKPEEAAQTIRDKAPAYGEAKAQRVYLEEFRKSQKALLMRDALEMGFEAARLDIEIFRTREATNRLQDRAHQ